VPTSGDVTSDSVRDAAAIFDPRTYIEAVPFAALARLRRQHGVVWVDEPAVLSWPAGRGFWLVLRHADVQAVLRNPRAYSSWLGGTQIRDPATPADLDFVRRMMLNMDPPEHTRLRGLLGRAFTPRAVAQLEDRIFATAHHLVERALGEAGEGELDFARDMAAELPLLTLADLLGVPEQDRWLLYDWSNRVIGYQDPDYAMSASFDGQAGSAMAGEALRLRPGPGPDGRLPDPRTRAGMADLYAYAHLLAEAKRRAPGRDDVMSILLTEIDSAGGLVSLAEFENLFWLFAVAGNETLRNGLPGAMVALLAHPDSQQSLRDHPTLLATAVDELLRWWTPVMTFRRTATADVLLAGWQIQGGDKVVVSFSSANRDEAVFSRPDQLDLARTPNPHVAFGHGPHFCLGAHLARVQMRALLGEVLAQTGEIAPAGPPAYLCSNFQRRVKRLPIRWRTRV